MSPTREARDRWAGLALTALAVLAAAATSACAVIDGLTGSDDDGADGAELYCLLPSPCFRGPIRVAAAWYPIALVVAPLDGDDHLDVASGGSGGLNILFGDGEGGFEAERLKVESSEVWSIFTAGNFDGSPPADLAFSGPATPYFLVGLATAERSFDLAEVPSLSAVSSVAPMRYSVDPGAVDDLVVQAGGTAGEVRAVINDGTGQFTAAAPLSLPPRSWRFVVGDFAGDGAEDFVGADGTDVTVAESTGGGGFSVSTFSASSYNGVVQRFRGQGESKDWIASTSACFDCNPSEVVTIYDAAGSRIGGFDFVGGGRFLPHSVATGAFGSSGSDDLVVTFESGTGPGLEVVLVMGWTGEKFVRSLVMPVGGKVNAVNGTAGEVATGDLNGDHVDDVVIALPEDNSLALFLSESPPL